MFIQIARQFETIGYPRSNYGYLIVFCKTYMDVGSENLFKDELDAKNSKLNLQTNVGQKSRTLYFKRGNYV